MVSLLHNQPQAGLSDAWQFYGLGDRPSNQQVQLLLLNMVYAVAASAMARWDWMTGREDGSQWWEELEGGG